MLTFHAVFFLLGLFFGEAACTFIVRSGVKSFSQLVSCSACGKRLRPSECIPVLSYRVLNGKCGSCGRNIPKIYPAFELISGFVWLICSLIFKLSPFLPTALALISVALIAAATDINTGNIGIMPNIFLIITGVIWNISAYTSEFGVFFENLFGFFAASVVLLIIRIIKKDFIDKGDILFMATAGFVLGARIILLALFLAALIYFAFLFPSIIKRSFHPDSEIPLGPFLSLGTILSLFIFMPLFFGKVF